MVEEHSHFAQLSRFFERKLIAERGVEVISRTSKRSCHLSSDDVRAMNAIAGILDELLEGENVLAGSNLTHATVGAGIALQEVIRLTHERRAVGELVEHIRDMRRTLDCLTEGRRVLAREREGLLSFLNFLAQNAGQQIQGLTKGRMITAG